MEDDSIDMEDDSIDMGYLVTLGVPLAGVVRAGVRVRRHRRRLRIPVRPQGRQGGEHHCVSCFFVHFFYNTTQIGLEVKQAFGFA
jgi:hypothetical protein